MCSATLDAGAFALSNNQMPRALLAAVNNSHLSCAMFFPLNRQQISSSRPPHLAKFTGGAASCWHSCAEVLVTWSGLQTLACTIWGASSWC